MSGCSSPATRSRPTRSVFRKLGVSSRSEAVDRAKELGVIEPAGARTAAADDWLSDEDQA